MKPSDALPAPSGEPIQVDPPLSASGAGTTPTTNGTSSHGAAPTSSRLSSGQGIRASTPTQKASPLALFVGFSLAALFLIFFVSAGVFNALFQSGLEALVWTLVKSLAALIAAFLCFPFRALKQFLRRELQGEAHVEEPPARQGMRVIAGIAGVALCLYGLVTGVPAVIDAAVGPQPKAVSSCHFSENQITQKTRRYGTRTSYDNIFELTFEDGTSHTTTLTTSGRNDIGGKPGVGTDLLRACAHRSPDKITVYYYPFTWILADVRTND